VTVWKPAFGMALKAGGKEGEKVNEAMEKACCFLEVASTESGALVVVSGQG
jgi:hypothetical protein